MRKQVSPVFALIVVLVAIVLGAIWFMVRERKYQADWRAQSEALQRQRDMAIRSGRGRAGPTRSFRRGSPQPGVSAEPGAQGQPGAPSADQPEAAGETP